jgi:hypothetical protein
MEDVLSVYTRPHDPDRPLVCLDETSKQLVAESRSPMAVRPGSPIRVDYQYARNGVANLFMMFAPPEGCATSRSPIAAPPSGAADLSERLVAASRHSPAWGQAEAMAKRMRRTLIVTSAPILRSFSRIVPQVASANWVWASPMRRIQKPAPARLIGDGRARR